MNTTPKRSITTTKMVAQYYIDMSKYLLVLLLAFGLFHESPQSFITRPILIIVCFAGILSAGKRAERNLDRIEEEEEKEGGHR